MNKRGAKNTGVGARGKGSLPLRPEELEEELHRNASHGATPPDESVKSFDTAPAETPDPPPSARTETTRRKYPQRIVRPLGALTTKQRDTVAYNRDVLSALLEKSKLDCITPIDELETVLVDEGTIRRMHTPRHYGQPLPQFSKRNKFPPPSAQESDTGKILTGTRIAPYRDGLLAVYFDMIYGEKYDDHQAIWKHEMKPPNHRTKLPQPGVPLVAFQPPNTGRQNYPSESLSHLISPIFFRSVEEVALKGMRCIYE